MDTRLKLTIILMIFLSVISVAMAVSFYLIKEYEADRRQAVEDDLARVETVRDKLREELTAANEEKKRLTAELERLKEEQFTLRQDLAANKSMMTELEHELSQKDEVIDGLTADLGGWKTEKQSLLDKIKELEEVNGEIAGTLIKLEREREELTKQLEDAHQKARRSEVELPKVVVQSTATPPPPVLPVRKGEILTVNREFDFVIVNLGRDDNVNIGDVFSVQRDGRDIGKVQVEEVHDSVSAASIVAMDRVREFVEGDIVVTLR
ncbi:MAG: hypothetical protein JW844_07490 [Candidatus Omnitrophica bacterium]|nr:hypothetical protein [Candidatus Omnitrophota bacterium]